MDSENEKKKLAYPKAAFFILGNEFCERFSHYGLRAILALYLSSTLKYSDDDATIIYHIYAMLCYFFPLVGAIIADSFLGKFKTILYLSLVYVFGTIMLSFSSIAHPMIPYEQLSLLALLMIAIGTGGIKPCVSSFGGDQFVLPHQELQLRQFFSIFYFSINIGSLLSTLFTPVMRKNVKCFDRETCFPLAFGTPSALMVIATVIFVLGKKLYIMKSPEENIIVIFFACIWHALKNKLFGRVEKRNHWLEYADDKYSKENIKDIRAVLNVLLLFIPVPMFWALLEQQGSRWLFQATHMDGRFLGYEIKPDQMHAVNPLLILIFIPVFELYLYPLLTYIGIKTALQKISLGGLLTALSFVISAYVEFIVQTSHADLPLPSEGQIRIFNVLNCGVKLNPAVENVNYIAPLSGAQFLHIPIKGSDELFVTSLTFESPCQHKDLQNAEFLVHQGKVASYFIYEKSPTEVSLHKPNKFDSLSKNKDGLAKISVFCNTNSTTKFLKLRFKGDHSDVNFDITGNMRSDFHLIPEGTYDILIEDSIALENIEINPGEIDTLLLRKNPNHVTGAVVNLVPSNFIHMLWQLPQIVIISAAEVLYAITGLEFSFTQAPVSMKSVLSSIWLLTIAIGNLFVAIISEIKIVQSQAHEFLLYAALMGVALLIFIFLSMKYQYVENRSSLVEKEEAQAASISL